MKLCPINYCNTQFLHDNSPSKRTGKFAYHRSGNEYGQSTAIDSILLLRTGRIQNISKGEMNSVRIKYFHFSGSDSIPLITVCNHFNEAEKLHQRMPS